MPPPLLGKTKKINRFGGRRLPLLEYHIIWERRMGRFDINQAQHAVPSTAAIFLSLIYTRDNRNDLDRKFLPMSKGTDVAA